MYVRDSEPVVFSPRPFAPQPVTRVRWRGTGCSCPTISLLCNSISASPSVTLVCDSISASKSKCGYSHGGSYWRQKECSAAGSGSLSVGGFTCSGSISATSTGIYNSDCSSHSVSCGGSGSITRDDGVNPPVTESSAWTGPFSGRCSYTTPGTQDYIYFLRCFTFTGAGGSSCPAGLLDNYTNDCSESRTDPHGSASWSVAVTYSDEYTTAALKTNTEGALPSYAGFGGSHGSGQGTTCSATRALASDESSYSIRRFKYKFTFAAAVAAYTINWNEHFVPTSGSPTDTARSASVAIGDTATSVLEVTEGSVNGTTTITDITITVTLGSTYATCFDCVLHGTDPACDTSLATGQGCVCSAFLSAAGAQKFKYKFRFKGSPTAYLKLLWNETFRPILTSTVTYCGSSHGAGTEDPDPSHWTVTAKNYTKNFDTKCQKPVSAPTLPAGGAKEWDSDIYTVAVPGTKGTTYITDIRWSIVNTYNPTASSIPGVDQFAGSDTSYLCNSRTAAQRNCTPAA